MKIHTTVVKIWFSEVLCKRNETKQLTDCNECQQTDVRVARLHSHAPF